jgi:hypothetical protein
LTGAERPSQIVEQSRASERGLSREGGLRKAFPADDDRLSPGLSALLIATLSALSWADVIAVVRALLALAG